MSNKIPFEDEFETGDIILFSDRYIFPSALIKLFTESKYTHVGIILRDPTFTEKKLEGLYIFESTGLDNIKDVEDSKFKFGVQIRPFHEIYNSHPGEIYWRKLNIERNTEFYDKFITIHSDLHNKPYDTDPSDWFRAWLDIDNNKKRKDTFFCSAMVSYIYEQLGLLDESINWSIIRPKDLGTEDTKNCRLSFINCKVDNEKLIKCQKGYFM